VPYLRRAFSLPHRARAAGSGRAGGGGGRAAGASQPLPVRLLRNSNVWAVLPVAGAPLDVGSGGAAVLLGAGHAPGRRRGWCER
jgi:hypothetical protein